MYVYVYVYIYIYIIHVYIYVYQHIYTCTCLCHTSAKSPLTGSNRRKSASMSPFFVYFWFGEESQGKSSFD